jgi:hypothetical protein
MKTSSTLALCLALVAIGTRIQAANTTATSVPAPTPCQIVSQGANFNVWQWQTFEPLPNGQMATQNHSYTEYAGGLNYPDPATGQWVPSQELIEPYPQGAIAQKGQARVIYANNLNTSGAVDEETADGKRLVINVIGLMYEDATTGQSVQIAEVQDSEGQLISSNQVLYTNAFNGVKASVRFEYRRDGTEQDIILDAQPPAPEAFGIDSSNAELVAVTEFLSPPQATVSNLETNAQGLEPDQAVNWGATSLGRGKAFSLGGQDVPVTVNKQYITINGRYLLFEKVRYRDIQPSLSALPPQASNAHGLPGMASKILRLSKGPTAKPSHRPIRLALGGVPEKGYVLDYTTLNASFTNLCLEGSQSYFISGNVNLYGPNNTLDGGNVIKYAANTSITVVPGSGLTLLSQPYRPVVFTAKDDNSVGETISGSTGTPSGYYANPALNLGSMGSATLSEFRMAYANRGVSLSGVNATVYDAQWLSCATAISDINGDIILANALFSNNKTNFNVTSAANTISIQNATFNNSFDLVSGSIADTGFYVTNCAFVDFTNLSGDVSAGYNGFYRSPMVGSSAVTNTFYPLQPAGAANCYLNDDCAFLNAGTSNLVSSYPLDLLSLIKAKTTYPPIIYSNVTLSIATVLSPQAQRDNIGNPSLGYHYDPLDYVFGAAIATSNLKFAAGTAVGFFYNSAGGTYALALGDSVTASFNGTVTAPCRWARYSTVQEGGNGNWTAQSYLGGITGESYSYAPPTIQAQFTDFYELATEGNLFRDNYTLLVANARDCEFYCGGFGGYAASMNLTNCLMANAGVGIFWNYGANNLSMENCTVFLGSVRGNDTEDSPWPVTIVNCAFAGTIFYLSASGNTNGYYTDYNSFLVGSNTTPYLGGHEVSVTGSYNWQPSWFGNYYLLSDSQLIQHGSTTANLVGLYHFTTQTDQTQETNSIVDIGYAYVATDPESNGNPVDTNGDGVPDYLEDANGNGLVDSGEIAWNVYGDLGLSVVISKPRANSVVP